MKLLPIPKTGLEKILKPINRITDSCVLKIQNDQIYSVCSSQDNSIILYAKTNIPNVDIQNARINIINIKKLITGLNVLGQDGTFNFYLDTNSIKCESVTEENEKTFFTYHLVDDSIIKESPIKIEKITSLEFDTEFEIPFENIKRILAGYGFAGEVDKIYFYTKENKVYADIDDKTMQNIDNISIIASSSYTGKDVETPLPININIFKNLLGNKSDISVKLNTNHKVFVFGTKDENIDLKYIASALVK